MGLKHQQAGQAAHPVDVREAFHFLVLWQAAEEVTWFVIPSEARNLSLARSAKKEGILTAQTPFEMTKRPYSANCSSPEPLSLGVFQQAAKLSLQFSSERISITRGELCKVPQGWNEMTRGAG